MSTIKVEADYKKNTVEITFKGKKPKKVQIYELHQVHYSKSLDLTIITGHEEVVLVKEGKRTVRFYI